MSGAIHMPLDFQPKTGIIFLTGGSLTATGRGRSARGSLIAGGGKHKDIGCRRETGKFHLKISASARNY